MSSQAFQLDPQHPNRIVLIGYLEEAIPGEQMAKVEEMLRQYPNWRATLEELYGDLDSGDHTVAQIWRRHRLTCASRETLGALLVDALPPDEADYLNFHLHVVKCRWCQANYQDLKATAPNHDADPASTRRRRVFKTSVGHLPKK